MNPDKRRNQQPGLINEFLDDSNRESMLIKLYPREIRRLKMQFPEINISKDKQFYSTDLWLCTITKK